MEIKVNGIEIDASGAVVAASRQAFDLSDLKSRFFGRTNQFTIPKTLKNQNVFKNPHRTDSNGRGFDTEYIVEVTDNGSLIASGKGILQEAGNDYRLQVVDVVRELFDLMNSPVRDLYDADGSDFYYNASAYSQLKVENDSLWLWALDNQHVSHLDSRTLINNEIRYTRPHFSVFNIIKSILKKYNWSISDFAGNDKFKRGIISSNHESFYFSSYQKTLNQIIGPGTTELTGLNINDYSEFTAGSNYIQLAGRKSRIRIRGNISPASNYYVEVRAVGSKTVIDSFEIASGDGFVNYTSPELDSDTPDNKVYISFTGSGSIDLSGVLLYTIVEESEYGNMSSFGFQDVLVKTYDNLPDISQIDFFKEVISIFGIGFSSNQVQRVIKPFSYSEIKRENSIDWSGKFIEGSENMKPIKGSTGKTTYISYSNDSSIGSLTGSGSFLLDNSTLPDSNTVLRSQFSASPNTVITQDAGGGFFAYYDTADMPCYDDSGRVSTFGARMKVYYDIGVTGIPVELSSYFNSFDEKRWPVISQSGIDGKSLVEGEYSIIVNAFKKNRLVECYIMLSKLDFVSFDFSRPVYIKQLGGLFLVKELSNFIAGRKTECYLYKID